MVIEPRMTGLLLQAAPPDEDHLRVGFELDGEIPWLWFWNDGIYEMNVVFLMNDKRTG